MKNFLKQKYSKPIKINGTKKQRKEFIDNCNKFAPIAEKIVNKSIFKS